MLPTIATGNVGSALAGEYEVANSLRFDRDSNDKLTRTLGTPTNQNKFTISFWVKLARFANGRTFFSIYTDSSNETSADIQNDNTIRFYDFSLASYTGQYITSRVLRDPSAWYHLVFVYDSGNATAGNRIRIYINGTEETNFSTESNPSLNENSQNTSGAVFNIGDYGGGGYGQSGYMSEFVFIDGQALDPTSFGEFDSDTNIWKPIDVSGLTFGTNGFYLDFENSGSLGADVSGNGNNFTVNNLTSIDQTTDTPTNNYATWNPLHVHSQSYSNVVFEQGNTVFESDETGGVYPAAKSTIGMSSGKWYCEIKVTEISTGSASVVIGITDGTQSEPGLGSGTYSIVYMQDGRLRDSDSDTSSWGSTYTTNDIISIALDLDNNKLYFAKNGTWQNSADPSAGTNGVSITAPSSTNTGFWHFAVGDNNSTATVQFDANFGNPAFSITSGNSDANSYGNFEHSVPSGYYALNTKNLSEFG